MFGKIASFEFRYQIKNPVFWVAAGIFFLLTFGSVVIDQISIGGGGNIHKNAPFAIGQTHLIWTLFFMFVSTAFVANVVVRDDETGFGGILRSTRVKRFDYLYGRFAGAFAAAALAFLSVPLGFVIGSFMPWVDRETLGALTLQPFVFSYFALALPNIFLMSALFFALATVTRSMMWTYVGVVAFLVLYTVANIALDKPELERLTAMWEPLGLGAYFLATKYWTASERNLLVPAFEGLILYNRLFTLILGAAFLALPAVLFRFTPGKLGGKRAKQLKIAAAAAASEPPPAPLSKLPRPTFGLDTGWSQLAARTRLDMGQVFRSPAYLVLLALGLFNSAGALWGVTEQTGYGGMVHPLTRVMLPALMGSFSLIPMIIAIYYAGELVWREREKKTHEIIDASPVPDWAFVAPKTLAIALVLISTLLVSVLAGVAMQAIKGYDNFEFDKWVVWYILPQAVDWILVAVLAVFVQAISPHKFVGWGLMVLYLIAGITFGNLGFDHILYNYGATPNDGGFGTPMSDINGLGKFWIGAWIARSYWSLIAIILLVLSWGLWRRGTETRLWPRIARLPHRLISGAGVLLVIALLGAGAVGGYIYLNTNVWNEHRTTIANEKWQADYEKTLIVQRKFDKVPQPKIQSMKLDVDLRPHQPSLKVTGTYVLKNMTSEDIKEIHVRFDRDLKVNGLSIEGAWPKETLAKFNYRIFALDKPMRPGDQLTMSFITERSQKGFRNSGNERRVVDNGTFVDSSEFSPALGIWPGDGLQDRAKRRKYGLNPDLPVARLGDVPSRQFNYLRHDADFMSSDITVTTEADQTPIAPGRRVSDRIIDTPTGKRRQAHFVTSAPVMPFFSIQSARYAVKTQMYKGVRLEIYYWPAHGYNIDRMFTAMKASLDYYQANFSPYQFDHLRFIEFPAYADFAQAFAGTMPWSENLFFIADYGDPEKIDMVTYVGAHEIGHQWWAHQVIAADQEGMTMTSETLAQYSALRVMKNLYGEDQIRKFLKYELNSYLRNRGGQPLDEKPLVRVEGSQGYIHYRKGSLVMYRLAEEIGEDNVNAALAQFLKDHAFKGAPYPISSDLVQLFRDRAPADKQALITDLFEKITLYDVKVSDAKVTARKDGKFDVSLTVQAKKLYATGKGVETEAPMNEMLDIGVFTQQPGKKGFGKDDILVLERRPIHSGKQTLTFTVAKKPVWVGADPYSILIDRNSDDNLFKIGS
ncbi:MAG: aminopeptidase [Caulobacteraceae bacterium]|nr:MAG: aminopeptidase [Caulobacteraceae bacterium]